MDCESAADDQESPPACNDGLDNDNDGLIDLEDLGCRDDPQGLVKNPPACNNRVDDDEDGFTDFPSDPDVYIPKTMMKSIRSCQVNVAMV